jgi:hypothetical protein
MRLDPNIRRLNEGSGAAEQSAIFQVLGARASGKTRLFQE